MRPSAPSYIADFASASAMLRAISNFLHGKDFPALGRSPALKPLARAANLLPRSAREELFALSGALEGQRASALDQIFARFSARQTASPGGAGSTGSDG